jgi:DNA-3-methyladenine glycosylase
MRVTRRAARLPVAFFQQDVEVVARGLLGRVLVSEARGTLTAGRIVEVEAYRGAGDPASHAFQFRRHAQNEGLYGPDGSWYVYLSYGMHWCLNLVAGGHGDGSAVLLRALEPVDGLYAMRRRRRVQDDRLLCSGPGRLTQALGLDRSLDRRPMRTAPAYVLSGSALKPEAVLSTPRIGITRAADWPLRFVIRGSPWTSRGARKSEGRVD